MKTMLRATAVATAIALTNSPALSADVSGKQANPLQSAHRTGFFAGISAGGAWTNESSSLDLVQNNGSAASANATLTAAGSPTFSPSSALAGGQVGFNYQFAPQWLGGFEADWSYLGTTSARQTGSIARPPDPAADFREDIRLRSLATLRARLGLLVMPQLLLFLTGGAGFADIAYSQRIHFAQVPDTSFNQASASGWRAAPVVGAGIEYALAAHWSLKAEYLYAHFKTAHVVSANTFSPIYQLQHGLDAKLSVGRIGLNYRF